MKNRNVVGEEVQVAKARSCAGMRSFGCEIDMQVCYCCFTSHSHLKSLLVVLLERFPMILVHPLHLVYGYVLDLFNHDACLPQPSRQAATDQVLS